MTSQLMWTLIPAFILGACVGSFLNVCIHRVPRNTSIVSPGSACPNCGTPIPFYANIPVISFLALRGRCIFCDTAISLRYPLVEALTGFAGVLVCLRFGLTPEAVVWFAFTATLLLVSFIDLDFQIIPDRISIPGIFIFALLAYFVLDMPVSAIGYGILTGGGILYTVALAYYLIRRQEGMGGGDIKLLAMIGAATGVPGVLFTLFAGSILGTVAGIAGMLMNPKKWGQMRIPFGPFLSAGAILYVFFGKFLIRWYLS